METITRRFNKQYDSCPEVSRDIADDLRDYIASIGVNDEMVAQLELCLVEVANNTYEHAYQYQDQSPIEVTCFVNNSHELVIEISDYGHSMSEEDFTKAVQAEFIIPDPDDPETWTTSGRGFIIVVELTDNLEYVKDGDKNTFKLYKRIER